jgi:hypothetical protein
MEYQHRLIIRFLFKENANVDDIYRKLEAQFTDGGHIIRSADASVSSSGKSEKTSMTIGGRMPSRSTLST